MALDLTEFSTTIAVGFSWLAAFALIACSVNPALLKNTTSSASLQNNKTIAATLIFIFAMIIGIIAENASDRFVHQVDDGPTFGRCVPSVLQLKDDSDLKVETLFPNLEASPRAKNLAIHGLIAPKGKGASTSLLHYEKRKRLQDKIVKAVKNDPDCKIAFSEAELKAATLAIYFEGRSAALRESNYYDQLSRIQTRIDFSRSMAHMAVIGIIVSCLLFAAFLFCSFQSTNPCEIDYYRRLWLLAGSVVVFLSLFHFTKLAYESEEREYNKNVFDYYVSLQAKLTPNDHIGY